MAARPPTIGDLTDELLLCVFTALPTEDMRDRCVMPRVCRRWRALAAAPAGAPLWARAAIQVVRDLEQQLAMLRWLSVHGPHVRELELGMDSEGGGHIPPTRLVRTWHTVMTAMALAPRMLELELDSYGARGAEWWRHLGRGLTRLVLYGQRCAVLGRAHELGGLPAALLELELYNVLGEGPHADLPRALGALSHLTFLRISDDRCTPAAGEAPWRPLRELTALRSLSLGMKGLEELPAAVGALTAMTSADFSECFDLRGKLDPLAPLAPSLRWLAICPIRIPSPSALTALTALEELAVGFEDYELRDAADAQLVEPGPHLHRLRALAVRTHSNDSQLIDVRRRLVDPLRAAAALTALEFREDLRPSAVLLTMDCIGDLLAGKPAMRRFALQRSHALKLGLDLAALRARRHPAVECVLNGGRWRRPH